jgi:hypothetical protein
MADITIFSHTHFSMHIISLTKIQYLFALFFPW